MALQDELDSGLALAVRAAGSQVAFAAVIGKRQSTIQTWLANGKELPAEYVLEVERKLGISRHDLRPDLYPREERVPAPLAPAQHSAAQPSASDAPHPVKDADGSGLSAAADGSDPLKGLAA